VRGVVGQLSCHCSLNCHRLYHTTVAVASTTAAAPLPPSPGLYHPRHTSTTVTGASTTPAATLPPSPGLYHPRRTSTTVTGASTTPAATLPHPHQGSTTPAAPLPPSPAPLPPPPPLYHPSPGLYHPRCTSTTTLHSFTLVYVVCRKCRKCVEIVQIGYLWVGNNLITGKNIANLCECGYGRWAI